MMNTLMVNMQERRYGSSEPPEAVMFDAEPALEDYMLVDEDAAVEPLGDELSAHQDALDGHVGLAELPAGAWHETKPSDPRWGVEVPFKRELHENMHGPDVRALQRVLHKANYRNAAPTGTYRDLTRHQVARFQRHHGIRKVRGTVRRNTWEKMWPWMDGYDKYLCSQVHKPQPAQDKLDRFVKIAWWYKYRSPLYYLQQRPMYGTAPPPNVDSNLDCSEFVYVCAHAAGLPDPSGAGYTNWGNTYSYLAFMPHTSAPQRGDLVFYDGPSHVGIIVGAVRGVLYVIEHGSYGGPRYVTMRYRTPVAFRTFRGMKGM
jgi:hypothetical protein